MTHSRAFAPAEEAQAAPEPTRLLSAATEKFLEQGRAFVSHEEVRSALSVNASELATVLGVHRNMLRQNPHSQKVQEPLMKILKILDVAARISGGSQSGQAIEGALKWFKYQPLYDYGCKTPLELVKEGHSDAVLAYLNDCLRGTYA